jgi:hypothetical protein
MTIEQQEIVALLIIKKGGSFSNSYGLVKVLTWKFKIINFLEVIENIKDKKYISSEYNEGVGVFTLTAYGEKVVNENKELILKILELEFPSELEIIENL